jgi:predicted enzyme related to lactoylglutathione lyase
MNEQIVTAVSPVLDCLDPQALGVFYSELLGWEIVNDGDGWVALRSPVGRRMMSFQKEPRYQPPTWPTSDNQQQMMVHLDIEVRDLDTALAKAVALGAKPTPWQPQRHVRVCTDPAGHVFCLCQVA